MTKKNNEEDFPHLLVVCSVSSHLREQPAECWRTKSKKDVAIAFLEERYPEMSRKDCDMVLNLVLYNY